MTDASIDFVVIVLRCGYLHHLLLLYCCCHMHTQQCLLAPLPHPAYLASNPLVECLLSLTHQACFCALCRTLLCFPACLRVS